MASHDWAALGRSAVRLVADRVLRGLLALGAMATGVAAPGWWRARGEHWWEGASPAQDSGPRAALAKSRVEPGALNDPEVLRRLRTLRGSQDLPPHGAARACADAAPAWHPERRRADGG